MSVNTIENKLVPKLRFAEFDEEWVCTRLKDSCSFFSGGTPTSTNRKFYIGNIPFIGSGNIYDSKVKSFISEEALNSSSAKLVEKGDLLYALYGANSGDVAVSQIEGAINQAILCIRSVKINILFLNNILAYNKQNIVAKYLQGGQGNLSSDIIKKLKHNLPTLPEQEKIANFLEAVDQRLTLLQQKKQALEQYKKGVLQQLFSGALRFKKQDGTEFPKWEEKKLGEVCTFFSGGTPTSTNKKYYYGKIPFIGSGNIKDYSVEQFITEQALSDSSAKMVNVGDILYALYGATSGEVAMSKIEGAINQAVLCIRTKQNEIFLYQMLKMMKEKIISKYIQGGQGNLSSKIIKDLKIKFPCLEEQEKIASFLSSIDVSINKVAEAIGKSQEFKKGLLQQMFV